MPSLCRVSTGTSACVAVAGCVTNDSTPPRLSARIQSFNAFITAMASAGPAFNSKLNIPPNVACCRSANAFWGNESNPG